MPQVIVPAAVAAANAVGWTAGATFFGTTAGSIALKVGASLALSVAASALARAQQPDGALPSGSVQTATTSGSTRPQTFVLGKRAIAGHAVAPPMSHGIAGTKAKGRHRYLTYVLDLGDLPIEGVTGVIFQSEVVTFSGLSPRSAEDYLGTTAVGDLAGYVWLTSVQDGTQTAADTFLRAIYDDYPERPWTADIVLEGVPYAVLNFRHAPDKLGGGFPQVQIVVEGVKLYDPRKDSSVGGSGSHRWNDQATWEWSRNPMVQAYNLWRGLPMPDGQTYGVGVAAADLPLSYWTAAMNVCDADRGDGQPAYRSDLEVSVADEPLAVIGELAKACGADFANVAGQIRVACGAPAASVYTFTDDDVLISRAFSFDPIPGAAGLTNGGTALYWDAGAAYRQRPTEKFTDSDWLAEDGGVERLARLDLQAVTDERQAHQVLREALTDGRRHRGFVLALGPAASHLAPLDTVTWESDRYGWTKAFEVRRREIDPRTLTVTLTLRERDPADYNPDAFDANTTPVPSGSPVTVDAEGVDGFTVTGTSITNASGRIVPAAVVNFDADPDSKGSIAVEFRDKASTTVVSRFTLADSLTETGAIVTAGLTFSNVFQARARDADVAGSLWTAWTDFTTPAAPAAIQPDLQDLFNDLNAGVWTRVDGISDPSLVPAPSNGFNRNFLFLSATGKAYEWDGSAWELLSAAADAADLFGQIDFTKAQSLFAARALAAEQLAVMPFSLVANPSFEDGATGWTDAETAPFSVNALAGRGGGGCLQVDDTDGGTHIVYSLPFDVEPDTVYSATGWVGMPTAATFTNTTIGVQWQEADGTPISPAGRTILPGDLSGGWQRFGNKITSPSNARRARYRISMNGMTTGRVRYDDLQFAKADGAQLIVDGSLIANEVLATQSITAPLLSSAGLITLTAQIDDLIITRGKVQDAQIAGSRISLPAGVSYTGSNFSGWSTLRQTIFTSFSGVGSHILQVSSKFSIDVADDAGASYTIGLRVLNGASEVARVTTTVNDNDEGESRHLDTMGVISAAETITVQLGVTFANANADTLTISGINLVSVEHSGK